MNDERIAAYLDGIDRAMNLRAVDMWQAAYERGLVSAAEHARFLALCDTHPLSWKGWLRWATQRDRPNRRPATDETIDSLLTQTGW